jgi:MarR family transcriptional regulator, 2-MHQ and catechol-resistance regulon repressor
VAIGVRRILIAMTTKGDKVSQTARTAAEDRLSERIMELAKQYQLRSRNRICRHGITVSQCYALDVILKHGGLLVTELGRALSLDKSTASRLAEALTERRLTKVEDVPGNEKKKRIVPTAAGRVLGSRIAREIRDEHRKALSAFGPRELQACERVIGVLLASPPIRQGTSPESNPIAGHASASRVKPARRRVS